MTSSFDDRELAPLKGAHQLDEIALNRYLGSRISGFEGKGNIRQFLGGQSNPTFLIDDASGQYVLRKKPPGILLPSAHAVDREFRIISALRETDVPVPKTYLLCEDESIIGQMFYVMEYVSGRVIDRNDLPGCQPNERTKLLHSMAEVFGVLHAIDYQTVGLGDYGRPTNYVARQVARWSRQYEASKTESFKIMDHLIQWLKDNDPEDDQSSIVHGDFRPGNMIFHPGHADGGCAYVDVCTTAEFDEFVHLGFADGGVTLAVLAAQGGNDELAANGFAILVILDALGKQRTAEIGQALVVFLCQSPHGLV